MQVRLGNFDVVAENVIEADLQRLDLCARTLARFDLRNVLAAVAADIAQLIQLGMVTGSDGAAIGKIRGRLLGYRGSECDRAASGTSSSAPAMRGQTR